MVHAIPAAAASYGPCSVSPPQASQPSRLTCTRTPGFVVRGLRGFCGALLAITLAVSDPARVAVGTCVILAPSDSLCHAASHRDSQCRSARR